MRYAFVVRGSVVWNLEPVLRMSVCRGSQSQTRQSEFLHFSGRHGLDFHICRVSVNSRVVYFPKSIGLSKFTALS